MDKNKRRKGYDVTDNILVTSASEVCSAVREIYIHLFDEKHFSPIQQSFEDFEKLFEGEFEGYNACDTFYHDKQHTLDMTLALARLIEGYQQSNTKENQLSADYAAIGIITALYHDSGYIRELDDEHTNGAVFTKIHVTRSASFLSKYLPMIGVADYVDIASNIVHYTGYEVMPNEIKLKEDKLHTLGYMLGSADLIAQMSDRCYLEKCRDRLYPEFVLGRIAEVKNADGSTTTIYSSGEHLLQKTPDFYNKEINSRLNNLFNGVYKYAGIHFGKKNLYIDALEENITHLLKLLSNNRLDKLKRIPLVNNGIIFANSSNAEEIRNLIIK